MKNEKFISLLPLETERLIIKPTSIKDIDMMLKMDKQEETQKFLGGIKNKTYEERIAFLEKKTKKFSDNLVGSLTVYLKEDETPIGFIGFEINDKDNNAEISYIFDIDYTKKGYCIESSKKMLEIGFNVLELNKIFADTIRENINSLKLLEKLNFKLEGSRREQVYVKELDKFCDFLDYGILRSEYK